MLNPFHRSLPPKPNGNDLDSSFDDLIESAPKKHVCLDNFVYHNYAYVSLFSRKLIIPIN